MTESGVGPRFVVSVRAFQVWFFLFIIRLLAPWMLQTLLVLPLPLILSSFCSAPPILLSAQGAGFVDIMRWCHAGWLPGGCVLQPQPSSKAPAPPGSATPIPALIPPEAACCPLWLVSGGLTLPRGGSLTLQPPFPHRCVLSLNCSSLHHFEGTPWSCGAPGMSHG